MKKIDEMIYLGAVEVEISAKTSHLEPGSGISTQEDEQLDKLFKAKEDEARLKEQSTGQQLVGKMIRMHDVRDLAGEVGVLLEEISENFVLIGMNCFDVDLTEEDQQKFEDRLNTLDADLQSLTGGIPTVLYRGGETNSVRNC